MCKKYWVISNKTSFYSFSDDPGKEHKDETEQELLYFCITEFVTVRDFETMDEAKKYFNSRKVGESQGVRCGLGFSWYVQEYAIIKQDFDENGEPKNIKNNSVKFFKHDELKKVID
jgi:hypothetical protein